jgi:hypothetical protein
MTAEAFRQWLAAMIAAGQISDQRDAARLLGIHPNTITNYVRDGAPLVVAHACSNLWHRLGPWGDETNTQGK